jgi:hypothetical protein
MTRARELAELATAYDSGGSLGFRNKIINGDCRIDQRNAGASVTPTNGQYTLDRFAFGVSQASKLTTQQSSTAPTGFVNSLAVTSSSAYSITSGDQFFLYQPIEGLNCADLAWGTSSAATVTLSFWVRSSLTGTFGGGLSNNANDRSYPFAYTISSANTWEQKTITIAGDTTGTWLTTNSGGIKLFFGLGIGSTYSSTAGAWAAGNYKSVTGATSVVGTNGATWYVTGVQLEKGSTATSFDYRPYGTELALCQRYFNTVKAITGTNGNTSNTVYANVPYSEMRATPTYAVTGALVFTEPGVATRVQSSGDVSLAGSGYTNAAFLAFANMSGITAYRVMVLNSSATYLTLSAEL